MVGSESSTKLNRTLREPRSMEPDGDAMEDEGGYEEEKNDECLVYGVGPSSDCCRNVRKSGENERIDVRRHELTQ